MKLLASLVFVAAVAGGDAGAAELKMFTSRALSTVLEVIGHQFEQSSGHKLNVIVGFSPEFAPRVNGGEAFDLMMSPPPVIDGYIKDGKLKADTRTMLVSSEVGVGVKTKVDTMPAATYFSRRDSGGERKTHLQQRGFLTHLQQRGFLKD